MPRVFPEYKDEAKNKIIAAAIEAAGEKGFSKVKMGDVAKRLGISRSTLYIYFKDKEELIREILAYIRVSMINRVNESLKEKKLQEAFSAIFNGFIYSDEFYFGGGVVFEVISETEHNEKIRELVKEHYIVLGEAIANLLKFQQNIGKISKDIDADTAARTIQALTIGLKASSLIGLKKEQALLIWEGTIKKILDL